MLEEDEAAIAVVVALVAHSDPLGQTLQSRYPYATCRSEHKGKLVVTGSLRRRSTKYTSSGYTCRRLYASTEVKEKGFEVLRLSEL
jgi:hypothetical protein